MQNVRHHALDNLRAFIVFLVVLLHAALSYMAYAPQWWYVLDPERSLFFTVLVLLIDVPIMLIMFFLAGYFTFGSLSKRGPKAFLKDKLVRIGIPWAFGALVLAPPTAYMIYYSRRIPISLGTFWRTDFWGAAFQQSVYWYLGVLLLFFTLTALLYSANRRFAAWRSAVVRPTWRLFLLFVLGLSASSLLIGIKYPLDLWSHIYLFVYQPARVPLYIGYFALGIFACQRGWFTEQGYSPTLGRWLAACMASGLSYLLWRLALPPTVQTILSKAMTTLLFNAFCFSSLLASIALFQTHVRGESPFWRNQARNSYGVYYLHPLVLYPLALLFVPCPVSIYIKATAITLLAYLASWGVSAAVLTRLPGLRRMF